SGAGDRCLEAIGLGERPHGHVTAIAPAAYADAGRVDRGGVLDCIEPAQYVAQVAVTEILDVRPGERLALPVAAARIGFEHEVSLVREHCIEGVGTCRKYWVTRMRR